MRALIVTASVLCLSHMARAAVPFDMSAVKPGLVAAAKTNDAVRIEWSDSANRRWTAVFSLDPGKPLITSISVNGSAIVERAQPIYRCQTGKRRGGWDAFFDFPPSHPEGTHTYFADFHLTSGRARTIGDRVEVTFDGLRMGIFSGTIRYVIFPGSRLIEQAAVASTSAPDTAYFYDAGLRVAADADRRAGGNMDSHVSFYDSAGAFQTISSAGPEWHPIAVRYRAIASHIGRGTVAVFPPPHRYFFARDFTTNMGYVWHCAWRGAVSLGIRQLPDDNSPYYPWMNAPPGTEQRMSLFLLLDSAEPRHVLDEVLRYTHGDVFPAVAGFKTFAPHWHFAYTVQAMEKGSQWTPPFKPVLESMGVDAAMIMDFHGDGHPSDTGELRLHELESYYRACRAQSDERFLLIPAEEANVHLGGHWAIVFPKPVYWFMSRKEGEPFQSRDQQLGPVYRVANAGELLRMVRAESGYMYQTHPRTKGSTGYPDKIRDTEHFLDPRYIGAGWKAMPSDLSSPRLGERSLKLLDDMNNWGLAKRIIGEVDVFQIDSTHELYSHMNVNYVRIPKLPAFDAYGTLLDAVARGDFFVTTGEVLLPDVHIAANGPDGISVRASVSYTFPLELAEIVWGDGRETYRKLIPLQDSHEFGTRTYSWNIDAKTWKWARFAVWDAAGNGAFVNPQRRN